MRSRSSTGRARRLRAINLRSASIVAVAALLAGCGSGSGHGLTSGQRAGLIAQLEAAKVQAAAKNVSATEATLRRFRASVAQLERSGALGADAARALRLGARRVLARVRTDAAPPPAATPPVSQPAPPPPKKHGPKDLKKFFEKHGKGHGDGEGGD